MASRSIARSGRRCGTSSPPTAPSGRAHGRVDFAEVAALAAKHLQLEAAAGRGRLFDHVLIDEAQDLSPSHWKLLRAAVERWAQRPLHLRGRSPAHLRAPDHPVPLRHQRGRACATADPELPHDRTEPPLGDVGARRCRLLRPRGGGGGPHGLPVRSKRSAGADGGVREPERGARRGGRGPALVAGRRRPGGDARRPREGPLPAGARRERPGRAWGQGPERRHRRRSRPDSQSS